MQTNVVLQKNCILVSLQTKYCHCFIIKIKELVSLKIFSHFYQGFYFDFCSVLSVSVFLFSLFTTNAIIYWPL